jgi:hypothetical protein
MPRQRESAVPLAEAIGSVMMGAAVGWGTGWTGELPDGMNYKLGFEDVPGDDMAFITMVTESEGPRWPGHDSSGHEGRRFMVRVTVEELP